MNHFQDFFVVSCNSEHLACAKIDVRAEMNLLPVHIDAVSPNEVRMDICVKTLPTIVQFQSIVYLAVASSAVVQDIIRLVQRKLGAEVGNVIDLPC